VEFIREAYEKCPADGSREAMRGFPHLRKAHCMFGWDWGPRLPDAGIWRDISLSGINKARIGDVYVSQQHEKGAVRLSFDLDIEAVDGETEELEYDITVSSPDGLVYSLNDDGEIIIEQPKLWWPKGYGEQRFTKYTSN
jgi:beta-mannosidase